MEVIRHGFQGFLVRENDGRETFAALGKLNKRAVWGNYSLSNLDHMLEQFEGAYTNGKPVRVRVWCSAEHHAACTVQPRGNTGMGQVFWIVEYCASHNGTTRVTL